MTAVIMESMSHLRSFLVVVLFLLTGCASKDDPRMSEIRTPGKTKSEIHAVIGQPTAASTRPATGWRMTDTDGYGTERAAALFEKKHDSRVESCEAYWISHDIRSVGIYFDYYFYDADDRLIHFWRRFDE
jgi:hypothetical protein